MSRRNMLVIVTAALVSAICCLRTDHNRYGRYLIQVLDAINRWALEPVAQQDLFDAAMRGIVSQLDEYSTYISAQDATAFEADLEQQFGGIGVVVKLVGKPPQLTVVSPPRFGAPALKAGIRVGDKILAIDGVRTAGMTMDQVVGRMRGKPGEAVELTVLHQGAKRPLRLRIVRDTINIPSVLGDRHRPDGTWDYRLAQNRRIGYLRIITFGEKTSGELENVVGLLRAEGVQALVLDLRDNGGGLLTAAVATCDLFLPGGQTIVTIRGRNGRLEETFTSTDPGLATDIPLAILINRYTASAAEIVAACLQDHKRAVVIGERSWGKGTVQHVIPIEAGRSLLKLTVASYWRPSGQNIHRLKGAKDGQWGVTPNPGFTISMSEEQQNKLREYRSQRDLGNLGDMASGSSAARSVPVDGPLNRAIAYLEGRIDQRSHPAPGGTNGRKVPLAQRPIGRKPGTPVETRPKTPAHK